jgi:chlorobactene glucosyltransferase
VRLQQLADLLPALPWVLPFLTLPRLARRSPNLSDASPIDGELVSIIVPARNEAGTIETMIRAILASTYRPLELIVVDDQSTDGTAARVDALRTDRRLQLVRGVNLPEGWFGKPWACFQGYRTARGELLLFTDADTTHSPELLSRAVGALQTERADLLTISPRQLCVSFWERIVMPQIWFLLALRYSPASVNRARRPRDVIANGQFILTTRKAYETAGTHEAVRDEVAEDLALAQTYLQRGLKLHFVFAERLMETRMYRGLRHLIEGWSKNIYLGGRRSFPDEPIRRRLVPIMLIIAFTYWLIPPMILLTNFSGDGVDSLRFSMLIATAASAGFWMLICLGMKIPPVYGLAYPLGSVMGLYIALRSTWRGTRRVEWRGRVYGQAGKRESGEAGK